MGSKLTHTVSGAMASFKSANKANIESLKVYFNPIQEGTGDPSPSNVRDIVRWTGVDTTHCGKNIYSGINGEPIPFYASEGMMLTASVINSTTDNSYIRFLNEDEQTIASFSLKSTHVGNLWGRSRTIAYTQHITPSSGSLNCKKIMMDTNQRTNQSQVQIEFGENQTTYESYNGRTIPITFPAFGKNLLDLNSVTVIYASMAVAIGGNNVNAKPDGSFILAAGTYTFSVNFTADVIAIVGEDGYTIGTVATNASSCTFTISKKQSIRIIVSKAYAEAEELSTYHYQMEAGSFATSYEPFDNTLYGGYIDLITGNITVTHQLYTYNGTKTLNTNLPNTNTRLFTNSEIVSQVRKANSQFYCNYCKTLLSSPAASDAQPWTVTFSSAGWLRIYMPSSYETSEQANQYFSEHPLKILIELENPVTLKKLDSIQLKTLQGQNHIWSNANGDIECTYEVIDHLNKKRIALNEPHIETVTGTNVAFNTDMKAPLKSSIINFSPIQEKNIYNGYWKGGKGKNKLGFTYGTNIANGTNRTISFSRNEIIIQASGSVTTNALVSYNAMLGYCKTTNLPPGTYTFSVNNVLTNIANVDKTNIKIIFSKSYAILHENTITTTEECNALGISYSSNLSWTNGSYMILQLQLEEGSSATSWSPYENTYPISGWNELRLLTPSQNINLVPANFTTETYTNATFSYLGNNTFELVGQSDGIGVTIPVQSFTFEQNKTYYFTLIKSPGSGLLDGLPEFGLQFREGNTNAMLLRPNGAWTNNIYTGGFTFSNTYTIDSIKFGITKGNSNFKIQVLISTSPITNTPISWESSVGTIYGGYIDLINGKLAQTYEVITLNSNNLTVSTVTNSKNVVLFNVGKHADCTPISNYMKGVYNTAIQDLNEWEITFRNGQYVQARLGDDASLYGTSTLVANYLDNNPLYVCLALETPITYQLTPIQLKSLVGTNNIWSNANGNIEVKYWTH